MVESKSEIMLDVISKNGAQLFEFAESCRKGRGEDEDMNAAIPWYVLAAEAGSFEAAEWLEQAFSDVRKMKGVPRKVFPVNADVSFYYLRLSCKLLAILAESGDVAAQHNLAGRLLQVGSSIHEVESALGWYKRAADAGSWMSCVAIASILNSDAYDRRDESEARKWYRKGKGLAAAAGAEFDCRIENLE